jgi:hypothetical protein
MVPANFRGAARRLDALDIPRIGSLIGVGEDEVRAILEVESRGAGFDKQGRPAMLFEPHIFWKELGPGKKRDQAAKAGLAYPRWRAGAYPRDSYPRLEQAMAIDETAAFRSASWGLGQLMGFNHRAAGFATVQDMVAEFCDDEESHLEAMIRFIKSRGLADEIQRHDWTGFARAYNGPGYAANRYDKRLAAALAKWNKVPDARFDPSEAAKEDEAAAAAPETFVDRARVKAVQEKLIALGYHLVGKPDGVAGPRTAGAIAAFQTENGLPVTGKITDELIDQLEEAEPHEPSPERSAGAPEDSRIVRGGTALKQAGIMGSVLGAATSAEPIVAQVEATKGLIDRVKAVTTPLRELVADHWPIILLVVGGLLVWHGSKIVKARVEDYRLGKTP